MADKTSIQPGSISLKTLSLRSPRQAKPVNIMSMVEEFSIFSNIYQPFMTAELMIVDGSSLFTLYPITGDEYVDIEFSIEAAGFTPLKKSFQVTSITDIETTKRQRLVKYRLRLVDPEAYNDWSKLVRKSYANMPTSDMAKKIFEEFLKLETTGNLDFSTSEGNRTIVIPSMTPSEAISFMARESKSSEYKSSNFVFYSGPDGFHFKTIDEMIAKGKVKDKYSLREKHKDPLAINANTNKGHNNSSGKPVEWLYVNSYTIKRNIDMENNLRLGAFDNTHFYIDPIASTYENSKYKYKDDVEKFQKIDKNPGGNFLYKDSKLGQLEGDSHHRLTLTNRYSNSENIDTKHEFLHLRTGANALMEHVNIEVTIPGDPSRLVGDKIGLNLPEFSAFNDKLGDLNIFLSGEYLVVGVRHFYNTKAGGYHTLLQCLKNNYHQAPEYSDSKQNRIIDPQDKEKEPDEDDNTKKPVYPDQTLEEQKQ